MKDILNSKDVRGAKNSTCNNEAISEQDILNQKYKNWSVNGGGVIQNSRLNNPHKMEIYEPYEGYNKQHANSCDEIEFVIGAVELGYNSNMISMESNLRLYYINDIIDFSYTYHFRYTYLKGTLQYVDEADIISDIYEKINNILASNNNLNIKGFRIYLLENKYTIHDNNFGNSLQEQFDKLNSIPNKSIPITLEPLMKNSFAPILGSLGGMYAKRSNLVNPDRADNYYSFFLNHTKYAFESMKELEKSDIKFLELIKNRPGIINYMIDNKIGLNLISEDVNRIANVALEANHRM